MVGERRLADILCQKVQASLVTYRLPLRRVWWLTLPFVRRAGLFWYNTHAVIAVIWGGPAERCGATTWCTFSAARLAREEGLHAVVEAMEIMLRAGSVGMAALSVAGPPQDSEYLDGLQRSLHVSPLREHVRFLGRIPWERMPELYEDHEVYLLPSVFEEPFSIGLLEAMASRLAVVGTTTGGSREVLVDGENSLTFPAEDAPTLAAQLQRVLDPTLRARLAAAGRRTAEQRFPRDRILSKVEVFLQNAVAQHRAGRQGGGM